jgi:hypothetical protein
MRRFEALGYGPVRFAGGIQTTWWGATAAEAAREQPVQPNQEVAHSSSITRPVCACEFFNQEEGAQLGQGGCATPVEGVQSDGRPVVTKDGEGVPPALIVGGIGVAGLIGLLAAGVI